MLPEALYDTMPNMQDIDKAAAAVLPLFRLNQWTWRGDLTPPTLEDLAAQFSSLAHQLDWEYGNEKPESVKRPLIHFAASGRLMVTRTVSYGGYVRYIYSLVV